ncbi:MAG: ABC transporter six-transmembrane domain-containing protein [Clostridia bacterium]|jgi:ABC-type multidrug transport system fused ATPase/permease subunit|nr:ABC transporter six-transmembrane domain-containing protein [Clostridia bacterium]
MVRIIKKYLSRFEMNKKYLALMAVVMLLIEIIPTSYPIFYGKMVDSVMSSEFDYAILAASVYVSFKIAHAIFSIMYERVFMKHIRSTFICSTDKIYCSLEKKQMVDENLLNKAKYAVANYSTFIGKFGDIILESIISFIALIVTFGILMVIDFKIGLAIIGINVLLMFFVSILNNKRAEIERLTVASIDELMNAVVVDKTHEEQYRLRMKNVSENWFKCHDKDNINWNFMEHGIFILYQVFFIMLVIYLIMEVKSGAVSTEKFVILITYYAQILSSSRRAMHCLRNLSIKNVVLDRILECYE